MFFYITNIWYLEKVEDFVETFVKNREEIEITEGGGERVFNATPHVNAIFTTLASGGDLVDILDTYITQKVTNGEDQYKLSRAVIGEVNKIPEEELPDRARIIAEISSKYKDPNF